MCRLAGLCAACEPPPRLHAQTPGGERVCKRAGDKRTSNGQSHGGVTLRRPGGRRGDRAHHAGGHRADGGTAAVGCAHKAGVSAARRQRGSHICRRPTGSSSQGEPRVCHAPQARARSSRCAAKRGRCSRRRSRRGARGRPHRAAQESTATQRKTVAARQGLGCTPRDCYWPPHWRSAQLEFLLTWQAQYASGRRSPVRREPSRHSRRCKMVRRCTPREVEWMSLSPHLCALKLTHRGGLPPAFQGRGGDGALQTRALRQRCVPTLAARPGASVRVQSWPQF